MFHSTHEPWLNRTGDALPAKTYIQTPGPQHNLIKASYCSYPCCNDVSKLQLPLRGRLKQCNLLSLKSLHCTSCLRRFQTWTSASSVEDYLVDWLWVVMLTCPRLLNDAGNPRLSTTCCGGYQIISPNMLTVMWGVSVLEVMRDIYLLVEVSLTWCSAVMSTICLADVEWWMRWRKEMLWA